MKTLAATTLAFMLVTAGLALDLTTPDAQLLAMTPTHVSSVY